MSDEHLSAAERELRYSFLSATSPTITIDAAAVLKHGRRRVRRRSIATAGAVAGTTCVVVVGASVIARGSGSSADTAGPAVSDSELTYAATETTTDQVQTDTTPAVTSPTDQYQTDTTPPLTSPMGTKTLATPPASGQTMTTTAESGNEIGHQQLTLSDGSIVGISMSGSDQQPVQEFYRNSGNRVDPLLATTLNSETADEFTWNRKLLADGTILVYGIVPAGWSDPEATTDGKQKANIGSVDGTSWSLYVIEVTGTQKSLGIHGTWGLSVLTTEGSRAEVIE